MTLPIIPTPPCSVIQSKIKPVLGRSISDEELKKIIKLNNKEFQNFIKARFEEKRKERIQILSIDGNKDLERRIFLQNLDFLWRSHLQYLEHLRQVFGLRGYGQKDPLDEFKKEAFNLFENLLRKIKIDMITFLNNLVIVNPEKTEKEELQSKKTYSENSLQNKPSTCLLILKKNEKISRNDRCEATGKKFKNCCGRL